MTLSLSQKICKFIIYILFLVIIFFIYKSEIVFDGHKRGYYLTNIILLFLPISALLIVYKFKDNKLRVSTLIVIFTTFFTFHLINFYYLITNFYQIDKFNIDFVSALKSDLRTKKNYFIQEYNKNKSLSIDMPNYTDLNLKSLFSNIGLENQYFYFWSEKSNSITIQCNENGYYTKYISDQYGFRNDNSLHNLPIKSFFIGDSFGTGECSDQGQNIPEILNKKNKFKFINFSSSGTGPLAQYGIMNEYIDFKVKNIPYIVWMFSEGNDYKDFYHENKTTLKKYLQNKNYRTGVKLKQKEIDNVLTTYFDYEFETVNFWNTLKSFVKFEYLRRGIRNIKYHSYFNDLKNDDIYDQIKDDLRILYKNIATKTKLTDTKLIFLYMPAYNKDYLNNKRKTEFFSYLKKNGFKIIEVPRPFTVDKEHLPVFGGHLSLETYSKISDILLSSISQK